MDEKEPNLVTSGYSKHITQDGITIELCIYRLEDNPNEWALEVINDKGTSIIWDDMFSTDDDAYAAFKKTVEEEGMTSFLDSGNIIQFPAR